MRRETVQRIVVRGPNWLGDAVMCEPALSGLRRIFPQASLTWLVKPAVAELLAWELWRRTSAIESTAPG